MQVPGATLAACGLAIVVAGPAGRPVADEIYLGGPIVLDERGARAEAIAIGAGRVLATGSAEQVEAWAGPATEHVGLAGRILIPSLKDHHVHLLDLGLSLLPTRESGIVDLAGATSLEEVGRRLAARARELPPHAWVVAKGWSQAAWGGDLPDQAALTRACPDNPVFAARVDGHAGWTNAAGLRAAKLEAGTPDPPGGAILRDRAGSPSGVLLERANEPLLRLIPWPTDAALIAAYRAAAGALSERGVTDVYDAGALAYPGVVGLEAPFEHLADLLASADRASPLPVRVRLMIPAPSEFARRVVADPEARRLSPRVEVTHLKLFADGALGSRGAALRQPYADARNARGILRMTTSDIQRLSGEALDAGLDVATHAIGDAAVGSVLDAYEAVLDARPGIAARRLRIEHASLTGAADRNRAARLGVVLVVQPGFVGPDAAGRTMESSRVGRSRAPDVYALGSLLAAGVALAGSTDDFSVPSPPLAPAWSARTRRSPSVPGPGFEPEQALDAQAAFGLLVRWYPPGGGEPASGLAPGSPADLAVVSVDPLGDQADDLLAALVHRTVRAGRVVYDDGLLGH